MTIRDASVGRRLGASFAVLLALCLFSSLLGMWEVRKLAFDAKESFTKSVRTEQVATDLYNLLSLGVQRTTAVAKSSDPTLYDFFAPGVAATSQRGGELARELKSLLTRPEEVAVYEATVPKRDAYYKYRDEITRLKKAGDAAGVEKVLTELFLPASNAYLGNLRAVVDMQRQEVAEAAAAADAAAQSSTWLLGGACVSALAIGLVLAWRMTVSITRPLLQARSLAETVAALDLRGVTARIDSNDEIAKLRQSLQQMRDQLREAVQGVNTATDGIASASGEIAVGTQDLSQRTEEAASNLQAVAGSMEELTGTVRQTADAARMAQQLAASAQESAASGSAVVSAVTATMQQINATSDKIADIVGVIDGIAFQTNILALNAAVEAARAGESGRGFAVVASEVRGLAGRSAEAAREIKKLIHASAERVEDGTRLVGDAERAMVAIQGSVQRVTDVIGEISAATGEQSQGLLQVNGAVGHLEQMTQQNAALVEQSTAATESLKSQAAKLLEVVQRFHV